MEYLVGTSGWNYWHWRGRFYPQFLSNKEWFSYYAQEFNTVEINYSFYHWPQEKTMEKWYQQAPVGFRYSLKLPRTITHLKRLKGVEEDVKRFYELTKILRDKICCHLIQLPPSFRKTEENLKTLEEFMQTLDKRRNNVIEFRHPSWWNKKIYDLMEKYKVCFCSVSGLGMPDEVISTCEILYIRFHGERYNTRYSTQEIREYARRILESKTKEVCAYFNNDACGYAIENAKELKTYLSKLSL